MFFFFFFFFFFWGGGVVVADCVVFSFASGIGKSHKGQDLANKEDAEARQPFPDSDICVQWPLCMTKHCRATS